MNFFRKDAERYRKLRKLATYEGNGGVNLHYESPSLSMLNAPACAPEFVLDMALDQMKDEEAVR
jgi:hypothetical protein